MTNDELQLECEKLNAGIRLAALRCALDLLEIGKETTAPDTPERLVRVAALFCAFLSGGERKDG